MEKDNLELGKSPEQSKLSSAPPTRLTIREKGGIKTFWGPGGEIRVDNDLSREPSSESENYYYSKDGSLLALIDTNSNGSSISIFNTNVNSSSSNSQPLIQKIDHSGKISALSFSPLGTFFITWERITSEQKNNNQAENLIIWNVKTGEKVATFTQKAFFQDLWPSFKWSDNEKVCGRMVNNEVQFYDGSHFGSNDIIHRLKLENISKFAISPTPNFPNEKPKIKIATFVPEKKGSPGRVQLFSYPELEQIATKSFYKSQEAELLWNSKGTSLLILTRTEVDKSGKSYYGEASIHYMEADGKFESNVALKKDGPVHDCAWSPNGKEFAVVYGYMPSQTTLFDTKCTPLVDFGTGSKNAVKFSPNGRLLCIVGSGNVQGNLDIWDIKKVKKLTSERFDFSHFEWCPDSRHFVTAILFQRLKVDNGFKLWSYDGSKLFEQKFSELYSLQWQPISSELFPDRPPSPRLFSQSKPDNPVVAPKPAKYIHPNAKFSSSAPLVKREDEGPVKYKREMSAKTPSGPPGYDVLAESKSAKKNQKRRNKKKNKENTSADGKEEADNENETEDGNEDSEKSSVPSQESLNEASSEVDKEKKTKAIQKKLRQIEDLKKQQLSGKQLDKSQLDKLASEQKLLKELDSLK